MESIIIDAKKNYTIVPTEKERAAIQNIYAFAKCISPILIGYGFGLVFRFKKVIRIGFVALPLNYRLLHFIASRMILPSLNLFFLCKQNAFLIRKEKGRRGFVAKVRSMLGENVHEKTRE